MKKKTKYRSSNENVLLFWLSIALCLLGAGVSARLFYKSVFQTVAKQNEQPVAFITEKVKTVQRKLSNRALWDRLSLQSPVYNGDTIHTAPLSSTSLLFTDGTVLELSENTMTRIFRQADGQLTADVSTGMLHVVTAEKSAAVHLNAAGTSCTVLAESRLSAEADDEQLRLVVQEGSALLENETTLSAGSAVAYADKAFVEEPFVTIAPEIIQEVETASPLETAVTETAFEQLPVLPVMQTEESSRGVDDAVFVEPQAEPLFLSPVPASISFSGVATVSAFKKIREGVLAFELAHVAVTVDLSNASGLIRVPAGAFADCIRLSCIILPSSLHEIEADAFTGCESFTSIKFTGTEEQWKAVTVSDERASALVPEYIVDETY